MPGLKEIRARIEATEKTMQITKAMKLVAVAKLRRAQQQVLRSRPYAQRLQELMGQIVLDFNIRHPFIESPGRSEYDGDELPVESGSQVHENRKTQKVLFVVLTSDRGLCGSFNNQVIRSAWQTFNDWINQNRSVDVLFLGKKAAEYFGRRGIKAVDVVTRIDRDVSFAWAQQFAERIMSAVLAGNYTKVYFLFNEFISPIVQKTRLEQLLPISVESPVSQGFKQYIFEPPAHLMLDNLIRRYVVVQTYRYLSESVASEHAARMTAMESATNNCKELIYRLTLTFNKLRQEKITKELIEIISGAQAL